MTNYLQTSASPLAKIVGLWLPLRGCASELNVISVKNSAPIKRLASRVLAGPIRSPSAIFKAVSRSHTHRSPDRLIAQGERAVRARLTAMMPAVGRTTLSGTINPRVTSRAIAPGNVPGRSLTSAMRSGLFVLCKKAIAVVLDAALAWQESPRKKNSLAFQGQQTYLMQRCWVRFLQFPGNQ